MARSSSRADTCGDPSANRKATRDPILNDGTGHGACQQVTVTNIVFASANVLLDATAQLPDGHLSQVRECGAPSAETTPAAFAYSVSDFMLRQENSTNIAPAEAGRSPEF